MSCQLTNSNKDSLVNNLEIIKRAIETIEHNQNFKRQFLIGSDDMGRFLMQEDYIIFWQLNQRAQYTLFILGFRSKWSPFRHQNAFMPFLL